MKSCKNGHEFPGRRCRTCSNEYTKRWREQNKDHVVAYAKKYRIDNIDKTKVYSKEYRVKNLDVVTQKYRKWRIENLELAREMARDWRKKYPERQRKSTLRWKSENLDHIRETTTRYRQVNAEKVRTTHRLWRNANKDNVAIRKHNRYHAIRRNGGILPKDLQIILFEMQYGKCACCGEALTFPELDHIFPVTLGGNNVASNMQLLNKNCNCSKKDRPPEDFMAYRHISRWCEHVSLDEYCLQRELLKMMDEFKIKESK